MKNTLFLLFFWAYTGNAACQQIIAGPYLQNATPTSIHIMWETSKDGKNTIYWGRTKELINTDTIAHSIVNNYPGQIHRVHLKNLEPQTKYYYQVQTGNSKSEVFYFNTPPVQTDEKSFQFVAMSDMQRDSQHPNKFKEIVEEGVISFLAKETNKKEAFTDLGFILIPGDLTDDGLKHTDWTNDFFRQSKAILPYVPVYPVLGNHERNSQFYFNYFHLPDNGTPGYLEHWWYKDHGNVRLIGLNSNNGYRTQEQIDWLAMVLQETEKLDEIDFVFAQLHHPHKSELWIDGETDFTGKVIYLLEQFSSRTGKPTIHFYGHTHGYSRGQSQDHAHLWVNVATAGGRIDGWGEYAQTNYSEFSVSHSDYGFVLMEVDAGDDPKFKLVRVSRGDVANPADNVINDTIEVKRYNTKPSKPIALSPNGKSKIKPGQVLLSASLFKSGNEDDIHGESQWQVARSGNFTNPDFDIWKNRNDWYGGVNINNGINLTQQMVEQLQDNTTYYWRVRYRTTGLTWSDWSETIKFETK